jgi:hypothetical protein
VTQRRRQVARAQGALARLGCGRQSALEKSGQDNATINSWSHERHVRHGEHGSREALEHTILPLGVHNTHIGCAIVLTSLVSSG